MREKRYTYSAGAAVSACLAAGPLFVASLGVGLFVDAATRGPIDWNILAESCIALAILPVAMIVGFVLAAIPVALGSFLLAWSADRIDEAASPAAWIGTGALLGGGIGWLADQRDGPGAALILAATGATCAAICRRGLRRVTCQRQEPPAPAKPATPLPPVRRIK